MLNKNLTVLLARQRSGTHFLASVLNSHPEVHCWGEILNSREDAITRFDWNYFAYLARTTDIVKYNPDTALEHFAGFTHWLCDRTPAPNVVIDIKYNSLNHVPVGWAGPASPPGILTWFIEQGARVIRLTRRNHLRHIVSEKLANANQRWHIVNDEPLRVSSVALSPEAILKRLKVAENTDAYFDRVFTLYPDLGPGQYLEFDYEDMVPVLNAGMASKVKARLGEFLEVDSSLFKEQSGLRKSAPKALAELVSNYEQLADSLRGTRFERFLADEKMHQSGR